LHVPRARSVRGLTGPHVVSDHLARGHGRTLTRNGFSRAHFYRLLERGEGPRFFKIGASTRIAVTAEKDWIATREEVQIIYGSPKRLRRRKARTATRSHRIRGQPAAAAELDDDYW